MFGTWDPNNLFDMKGAEPPPFAERLALGTRIVAILLALLLWGALSTESGSIPATLAACGLALALVCVVDIGSTGPASSPRGGRATGRGS
jgi:hypothetical protein